MLDMQSQVLLPYPYPGIHFPSIHLFICNVYLVLLSSAAYSKPLLEQTDSEQTELTSFRAKGNLQVFAVVKRTGQTVAPSFKSFLMSFPHFPDTSVSCFVMQNFGWSPGFSPGLLLISYSRHKQSHYHRYITCYVSNSRCKTSKKKKRIRNPPPPFRPPFFCFHLWLSHMQKLNILYKANTKLFCFQLNVQESPTTAVSNQIK